jgi:hypothetical protein
VLETGVLDTNRALTIRLIRRDYWCSLLGTNFLDAQVLSPFPVSPSTTGTTPIRDRVGQFQVAESVLTTIETALLEGHTVRLCYSFSTVTCSYRFFVADDVQPSGFPCHGDGKSMDAGFVQT